jgi:DNA-directed RNA polymerase subunit RPC12/RpoP
MPVRVKLRCSECETAREEDLKMEETEITCPACGRRMANLQQNEYVEIETNLKKQQIFSIISLVAFGIAAILLIMWAVPHSVPMAPTAPAAVGQSTAPGFAIDWISGSSGGQASNGMFIAAIICGFISLVLGVLASMKRYIIEF